MSKVFAQVPHNLGTINGIGPLGDFVPSEGGNLFEKMISGIIGLLTVVAGIYFVFLFIVGAIGWLGSEGEKQKVATARAKITNGIIGLVVVIGAVFFIELIGTLLGLDILNPAGFVTDLWN